MNLLNILNEYPELLLNEEFCNDLMECITVLNEAFLSEEDEKKEKEEYNEKARKNLIKFLSKYDYEKIPRVINGKQEVDNDGKPIFDEYITVDGRMYPVSTDPSNKSTSRQTNYNKNGEYPINFSYEDGTVTPTTSKNSLRQSLYHEISHDLHKIDDPLRYLIPKPLKATKTFKQSLKKGASSDTIAQHIETNIPTKPNIMRTKDERIRDNNIKVFDKAAEPFDEKHANWKEAEADAGTNTRQHPDAPPISVDIERGYKKEISQLRRKIQDAHIYIKNNANSTDPGIIKEVKRAKELIPEWEEQIKHMEKNGLGKDLVYRKQAEQLAKDGKVDTSVYGRMLPEYRPQDVNRDRYYGYKDTPGKHSGIDVNAMIYVKEINDKIAKLRKELETTTDPKKAEKLKARLRNLNIFESVESKLYDTAHRLYTLNENAKDDDEY